MLESVYETGKATWSEDVLMFFARRLPLEEVYVRFTFGPILADDGSTVEGIFCPCTETTEQVVGARRLDTLRKLGVRAAEARSVEAACREAADALAENPEDIPFAAVYVADETGTQATLCVSAGLSEGDIPLRPAVSVADGDLGPWPLASALRDQRAAEVDLGALSDRLSGRSWPGEPVRQGLALPIPAHTHERLAGLLVAGVSPRRILDDAYRTFFDLVAGHIGAAIADARAYEEGRRRAEALAELDRAKTNIWESINDGFIAFDRDWRCIYINAAAEGLGLRRAELLGRTIWEALPEALGTKFEENFRRAAAERAPVEFEYYFAPWDRWLNNKVFPSVDGNLAVYLQDISDRKRAEEERARLLESEQEARRRAEDANLLKDEFLATISHELRTPLNSINGWAQLLRTGGLNGEEVARALETIERSARSLNQIINDLLDVSRIITGKMRLDVGPVLLGSIINAAVDTVRPAADTKEIRLSVLIDSSAEVVSGDAGRLRQVVWNLLSNAIKFAPLGGWVQVRLERLNSYVEITVADNGQGIKPEFLPYVFDRFRQEEGGASRRQGGLGLGLAIVRHLVELHGGTVRAESAGTGQGASFTVALPVAPARAVSPKERSDTATRISLSLENLPSLAGVRVLLVDDDADGRELVTRMLALSGAEVCTAGSTAEALAALDEWRPDVLISDIGMPGEDGYVLIKKLRALPAERGGRIPALALTAYAGLQDRLRALSAGYQSHVPKPVEQAELVAVLASLTNRIGKIEESE
jgi:PAS domain S-box-containing protein